MVQDLTVSEVQDLTVSEVQDLTVSEVQDLTVKKTVVYRNLLMVTSVDK